jgi:hypothetical protein
LNIFFLASILAVSAADGLPMDNAVAEIALRATIESIHSGRVTAICYPNSLYRDDEDCDVSEARIRRLDLRKLTDFDISQCAVKSRPKKCAEFLFDRGRGDGGVINLEVEIGGAELRTAADVKAIRISQFVKPR